MKGRENTFDEKQNMQEMDLFFILPLAGKSISSLWEEKSASRGQS